MQEIRQQGRQNKVDVEAVIGRVTSLSRHEDEQSLHFRVLQQITFKDQHERAFRIKDAHVATFRWLFDELVEARPSAKWSSLPSWLRQDEPLYWITGKAGAGKSTLMKYLSLQPQCDTELQAWAGGLPLVTTHTYFWNSGSKDQMSQEGLLRSILYQALSTRPLLIPQILPERWARSEAFGYDPNEVTVRELTVGFHRLVSSARNSYALCMFVDGLDEFDGDLGELIHLFKTAVVHESVKACLASRPWVVFEEAFQRTPSLLLQDLTYHDIVDYITAEFNANSGFVAMKKREEQFAFDLIHNIARKASGVFLWVTLVVKSLLNGLANYDRPSDLQRRLDQMPDDLEHFYRKMLDSIESSYVQRAYRYLRFVEIGNGELTALELYYADHDPGYIAGVGARAA